MIRCMQVGLIGVGKMGIGLLRRWQIAKHDVIAFDQNSNVIATVKTTGAIWAESLEELVGNLSAPRVIWLMVPAKNRRHDGQNLGPVDHLLKSLEDLLDEGDTIIDGGNSYYKDSQTRAEELAIRNINFIDVGVSGGVAGEKNGFALMIGGAAQQMKVLKPLFDSLVVKSKDGAAGFVHVGPPGSGHFVKMVHNAIEYGVMQAMGEGFDLLKNGPYQNLELAKIAELWSQGTIIRSYLMKLAAKTLESNGDLSLIAAHIEDSGEGRWSVETAVNQAVPFWANTAALYARFDSRQQDRFSHKLIAAMRKEFGGHSVKKSS